MRRWTDGKSWSASRVSGSFLTYREMEGKRGSGFGGNRRGATKTPDSGRGSDEDQDNGEPEGYRYKADGLMKQSFSITTSAGQHLHLISYYSRPQHGAPDMPQPSTDPSLRHITPVKGMYPESSLHDSNPTPALTRAPMVQHAPYMVSSGAIPQPYPPQYPQHPHGYHWPPSPVATPPYGQHYTPAPYPPHNQITAHPSHPVHQTPPPHAVAQSHHSQPVAAAYERASLPPITGHQKLGAVPHYQTQHSSPHLTHAQKFDASPRAQHLQAAAQAVLMDGSRQGPLPPVSREQSSHPVVYTPPNRASSLSPPRNNADANGVTGNTGNKTSISALLSSAPSSDTAVANGAGSNSGSPRTSSMATGLPPLGERPGGSSHDARALQMLDRKFCI